MPVVFHYGAYKFFFYSNEGNPREPMHIHVRSSDGEAKFWVNPLSVAESFGFGARTLRELTRVVEENHNLIERAWHEHFA